MTEPSAAEFWRFVQEAKEQRARADALAVALASTREALAFYANIREYNRVAGDPAGSYPPIVWESGARARNALAADQPAAAGAELLAAADVLASIVAVLLEKPHDGPSRRHYVDSWEPGLEALAAYRRVRAGRSSDEGPGREGA